MQVYGEQVILDARFEDRADGLKVIPFTLTHEGVHKYLHKGKVLRVLKSKEHFLTPEFLDSARSIPVTIEHPKARRVSQSNTNEIVGLVHDTPATLDGHRANHKATIFDPDAIRLIESKTVKGVSAGYSASLSLKSGTWVDANGESHDYDAIHENAKLNHLALTRAPRLDQTNFITDSQEAAIWLSPEEENPMDEIKSLLEKLVTDSQDKGATDQILATIDAKSQEIETLKKELLSLKEANEAQITDSEDKLADLTKRTETAAKVADVTGLPMQELVALDSVSAILTKGLDACEVTYTDGQSDDYLLGLLSASKPVHKNSAAAQITGQATENDSNPEQDAQARLAAAHAADIARSRKVN